MVDIMKKSSGGVDAYIASRPKAVRSKLREVRTAIRQALPEAQESMSYRMPYYSHKGNLSWHDKSIAWFGLQSNHIGLYLKPPTIQKHKKGLSGYKTTKSAVHIPLDGKVPVPMIKALVKASSRMM
jgi:uncharacterized protein YdhG (YjbR/CyaY superfamily)